LFRFFSRNKIFRKILKGAVFPVIILVIWEITARLGVVNTLFLPSPLTIGRTFGWMIGSGLLEKHLLASVHRLVYGFVITVLIAVPLGILVGKVRNFSFWINPTLSFLQQIPPIAWIPIFILWLGIDEASKVAVIIYAAFFPVFLNTVQGVTSVDPRLVEVGRAYMLSPLQMILRIYVPSAGRAIFVGLRLGLSNCWRALVGAELLGASSGIGYLITEGRQLFEPDKIFVAILTIGVAGMIIDIFLKKAENRLLPWKSMYEAGTE
jgi:sulfonate transport system permease protein